MSWLQKKPTIEVIATVAGAKLPWRRDAALVFIRNGRGALRWQVREATSDGQTRELMLGDTPLLLSKTDEYWCPTCEKLLALGLGRDAVAPELAEAVRAASNHVEQPPPVLAEEIAAVLGLLESGVYLVSTVPHFPTDGDGAPFWRLRRRYESFAASRDWYSPDVGLCEPSYGYPAFLLPTQPMNSCDWDTVSRYRARIRQGQVVGGLVYWAAGYLSALLDGHHRATAALLEGVPLPCVTIVAPTGVAEYHVSEKSLMFWDVLIPLSTLPPEAAAVESQRRRAPVRGSGVNPLDEPGLDLADNPELLKAARRFPTIEGLAAIQVVGDTSDSRITELLEGGPKGGPDLWVIFHALAASGDARALDLALRLGAGPWPGLRQDAFGYLAGLRSERVHEFFIDFLVRDEGQHPWLTEIANEYLAGEPDGD